MPLESAAITTPPEYLTTFKYRIRCDHCGKAADHWKPGIDAAHEQAVQEGFGKGKQGWLCNGCMTSDKPEEKTSCQNTPTPRKTAKRSKSKGKSKKIARKSFIEAVATEDVSALLETSPPIMANS
jgi:hypothetical protein